MPRPSQARPAPSTVASTTPVPTLAVAGLALAALASGMSLRVTDALLPRLAQEFTVTLGQASQVITVFAVAYGLAQLLFGPLGDRYGKYRVVGWACSASALTSLACALAQGHSSLLLARLAAGASAAAVIPLAMAWIGDVVTYERRQAVLARFLIGQIVGFALGVWVGGYTADHLDWRTPFLALAGLFLLVAAVLQRVRRGLPASALATQPRQGHVLASLLREFKAVLGGPWSRLVLFAVFFEGAALYGAFAFVASHLHQRFSLSLSVVGALVMLFALGGLGFALGARQLVQQLGETALVRWGSLLMALSLLAVALAPVWWWAMPACTLMGLGFYMMHNTLQTRATQMAPERRGAAVALFASSFFLGQSLGVGAAGLAVQTLGTRWLLALGAAGVLLVGWHFNRRRLALQGQLGP